MKKLFLLILVVMLAVPQAARGDRPFSVFTVSVVPDRASLASHDYKRNGRFYVDATVRNMSTAEQIIVVWTNYGWSWMSNTAKVLPGQEITNNTRTEVVLQPGDEYTSRVEMNVEHAHKKRPVVFRLGFTPQAEEPVAVAAGETRSDIYWSDPVRLVK